MEKAGDCTTCATGHQLEHNLCHKDVTNCSSFSSTTAGKCMECATDFVLTDTNACKPATENCKTHDGAGKCSVCSENYTLQHQQCNKNIAKCSLFSEKEVSKCATCATGYKLEHNHCHKDVQRCTAYSAKISGECKSCESSYILLKRYKSCLEIYK